MNPPEMPSGTPPAVSWPAPATGAARCVRPMASQLGEGPAVVGARTGAVLGGHPRPRTAPLGPRRRRAPLLDLRGGNLRAGRARRGARPPRHPAPRLRAVRPGRRHRAALPAPARTGARRQPLQRRQVRCAGALLGRIDGLRLRGTHRRALPLRSRWPLHAARRRLRGDQWPGLVARRGCGRDAGAGHVLQRHRRGLHLPLRLRPRHGSAVEPDAVGSAGPQKTGCPTA